MPVLLFIAVCTPPPGRGIASEAWYRQLQPAIEALEHYRREIGRYPDSLAALVPRFLPATQLSAIPTTPQRPLEYKIEGDLYELTFRYYGPGSNRCTYRPDTVGWQCSGLF